MFIPIWALFVGFGVLAACAMAAALKIRAVDRSARLFRAVAEGANDGLVLMERDSRILWTNEAYSRIMGYAHGELVGRYPLEYALPGHLAVSTEEARAFRFNEVEERFGTLTQMENVRKDGTEFIHEFSHAKIDVGSDQRFLLVGRDITDRVAREKALIAAQERLKVQSMTDTLTGLANRLHMQTTLEKLVREGSPFAVLQIDVNRMKQVNDTFGHQAGDAVLLHVARAFRSEAGKNWICARIGGDEFVAVLPGISSLERAMAHGRSLSKAASRPLKWKAATLRAELSVGAAIWDRTVATTDEVLNHSDVALYAAKSKGDGKVVGFDDALRQSFLDGQKLEREVAQAVRNQKFTFHFQPIINLETRCVEKFEMLVRWRHPERGSVPTSAFLPLVDQLGLASELDEFVVQSAEKALQRLDQAGLAHIGLAINLSADALASEDLTELLLWRVQEKRLDPARITLEILENTALSLAENDLPVRLLSTLKRTGFEVFLDDFGMGYAGLAHLASLPTSGLKIDRRLTSAIDSDPTSRSIVVALVQLANELGLSLIAEGVENMAQMEIAQNAGCAVFQGYAVSRPMPLKRAIAWAMHDQTEATGTNG